MASLKRSRLSASSTSEEDDPDHMPVLGLGGKRPSFWQEQNSVEDEPGFVSPNSSYASPDSDAGIGQKLMAKMGYKSGTGLGKHNQGIVAPVELSTQRGRRGLGLKLEGLEPANIEWDSSQEVVEVEEKVKWLAEDTHIPISLAQLKTWMVEGPPKKTLDDETEFCDPDVLRNVISSKSVFDRLDKHELMKARTRSNPFETIGKGIFLNRAAMKMANMDAVFDFMFTNPVSMTDPPHSLVGPNELLYFADVCAGPGGFSEYVLWRYGWEAKGFGMTLRDSNDFKLEDFFAAPCESFEPYYGAKEDGNVYDPANIDSLQQYVMDHTFQRGVHFMMADGGFSVDGQENIQEILSKQLYLCQCLVALCIVRTHGHFVVKMFDLFTPFSVGLIYLMYKSFYQITLHKPNTSRPANSERYLVCKWKRENTASIRDYLYEVNLKLNNKRNKSDVSELVPVDILKEDTQFYDFIYESNNILGERQIINLVKIKAFCQDTTLMEFKQADMKQACLEFWKVPNNTRTAPKPKQPEEKMRDLFSVSKPAWLSIPARELTKESLEKEITPYDWRCMLLEGSLDKPSPLTFYLGNGRGHVYSWDQDRGKWYRCRNIELSPGTLVYAELVYELRGEGRSQVKVQQLHIVDAAFLGGKDVRCKHLKERLEMCHKFALAINKPSRTELLLIRVKELFTLADMRPLYSRLEEKVIKGHGGQVKLGFNLPGHDEKFFIPGGVLFLKTTQDPWQMALSRSSNKKYWFNRETKQSFYECPHNSNMDFVKSFERRLWWAWTPDVNLFPDPDSHSLSPAKVHRCNIDSLLHSQMNR